MLRNKTTRTFLTALFTGLYLFVALFSQNFHNHGSGEVFRDFHFKKVEKTLSQGHENHEYTDCLSCHVFHEGKYLIPQDFSFNFNHFSEFRKQVFAYQQRFAKLELFYFQLRAPPENFI